MKSARTSGLAARQMKPALAAVVAGALGLGLALIGGPGVGSATACAQDPPTLPLPAVTLGPIDPACQRVPDTDNDDILDFEDNCHRYFNPNQRDTDKDAGEPPYEPVPINFRDPTTGGDACDADDDGDGLLDVEDNCPKLVNRDQADADGDDLGDACDPQTAAAKTTAPRAAGVPRLTIGRLPAKIRRAELGAGLAVPVSCTAPCALTAELTGAGRRLGRAGGRLEDAGRTFLFVRLSRSVRARVARSGRMRATIRVVATGGGGAPVRGTRRVVLAR